MQKVRIYMSARIPKDLNDKFIHLHGNMKTAINTALEILVKTAENELNSIEKQLWGLKAQIEEIKFKN